MAADSLLTGPMAADGLLTASVHASQGGGGSVLRAPVHASRALVHASGQSPCISVCCIMGVRRSHAHDA